MGFFRKPAAGKDQRYDQFSAAPLDDTPSWVRDGAEVALLEGREDLEVVGESHYQDNLWQLVGSRRRPGVHMRSDVHGVLVAEQGNPHDANAMAVWIQGLKVGYLSRDDSQRYRPGLLALQHQYGKPIALHGVIAGGGTGDDGPDRFVVFLRHTPEDFGLRRPQQLPLPEAWMETTTLSGALETAEAEGSHDLSWMKDLPAEDVRAIPVLRKLLAHEQGLLDRHFMYAELEVLLYRSRNTFAAALAEYDQTCCDHDAEMDIIRTAFMARWGRVPILETYRQMAIRQQKAHNFEQALRWAERGLAIYQDHCAWPEAVEDLRQRAAAYRAWATVRQGTV